MILWVLKFINTLVLVSRNINTNVVIFWDLKMKWCKTNHYSL